MVAIISELKIQQGPKGQFWNFKAGDNYVSCFSGVLGQQLANGKDAEQIGRIVKSDKLNKNGYPYLNLEPFSNAPNAPPKAKTFVPPPAGMSEETPLTPHAPNPPKAVTDVGRVLDSRDVSIQRQCALKAAAAYASACMPFENVDKTGADVTALASRFLAWLQAGGAK